MTEYIFYKISCIDKNIDYTYIGSTQNFRRRKCNHKSVCSNETSKKYNITLYKTIRENGGWENWIMSPIGKGMFEKKVDALIEEQKYINDINSALNINKAFMTKEDNYNYHKQYNEIHKEELIEKKKKYREVHIEEFKERDKKYYEAHKKEIIERQKKYYEAHKEEIIEKNKIYKDTHKEELSEKITCECGGCYSYDNKARHFRTKRHIAHFS